MKKSSAASLASVLAPTLVVGCATEPGPAGGPPPGAEVAASSLERDLSPAVSAGDRAALRAGNAAFALDLYREVRAERDGNVFFSPHGVSLALAMTYAGAEGETERQMAEALHFDLPEPELHAAFDELDLALAARDREGVRLRVVSQAWSQSGYGFLPSYLDVLASSYGAGLYLLDFEADPEGSRRTVNLWVSDRTAGRIDELIPPDVIDPTTRLVLTNAVYFRAAWQVEFDPDETADGPFHLEGGAVASVPMMRQTAELPAAFGAGYQAVELPYAGEALALLALLPDEGEPDPGLGLDVEGLEAVVAALEEQELTVVLPRFSFGCPTDLAPLLRRLGMTDAFEAALADLSGMDGTRLLYVQAALHEAFVEVTEQGTEAAAATAVVVGERGAVERPTLTFDRPFFFAIRDRETGAILFLGRLADPT